MPPKRCWLNILQVPAAAIAAFSSCNENPWISPAQQYLSYFFKQQEAVRMAPVSEALSSKATSASQCTTRRKRQAFKLVRQATATASAEGSRQTVLSFPYALSAQHQLQRAQVSQWYSSDILKGKTQKSRSSAGASYFQLYIFPATLTHSCSSIHSCKRRILLLPIFIGKLLPIYFNPAPTFELNRRGSFINKLRLTLCQATWSCLVLQMKSE